MSKTLSEDEKVRVRRIKFLIFDAVLFAVLVALDRVSKIMAVRYLKEHPAKSVIDGYLEFHYLENDGAAFGFLKGQKSFFILVSFFVIAAIVYCIIRMQGKRKFIYAHLFLTSIAAGALGNLVDRILYGQVIDFIYISVIKFPIFNVADIYVTINTFLLCLFTLFYYKEDDLNILNFKEKKFREFD